jgi:hypothetical protein
MALIKVDFITGQYGKKKKELPYNVYCKFPVSNFKNLFNYLRAHVRTKKKGQADRRTDMSSGSRTKPDLNVIKAEILNCN